jgi:hypothetical protein
MGKTFFKAAADVTETLEEVKSKYHKELHDYKVRFGVLMVMSHKEGVPALTFKGHPAAATVHVVSLKDRVVKNYDVEILIDADHWKASNDMQKRALLDHELSHVTLKKRKAKGDDDGAEEGREIVDEDDLGRPKIKMVHGDYDVGDGFLHIIRRYGDNSIELKNFKDLTNIITHIDQDDESE